jgi:hypothetical protein
MTATSASLVHLAANPLCRTDRAPLRRISVDATRVTCPDCRRTIVDEVLSGAEPDLSILPGDLFA